MDWRNVMPWGFRALRFQGVLLPLLILVTACDRPHPGEAMVLSVQQATLDPAAASNTCASLAPKAAGECLALLAGQVAPEDRDAASGICGRVDDPLWAGECWFLVAEATAAAQGPAAAVDTCARAGQFARNCLGHLWLDAATRAHLAHPDDPVAAWAAYAPTASWLPPGDDPAPARRHQGTFFDARFNPTGAGGEPPALDAAWCAAFDAEQVRACRQAAVETLQRQLNRAAAQGVDMAVLCSDAPLPERVRAATGIHWRPDDAMDRRAAQLVSRSCEPVSAGGPPR